MKALAHDSIQNRYEKIASQLNEKTRRCWAGIEAQEIGYGGIAAVSRATGLTPRTINRGINELTQKDDVDIGRQRKPGGGRKPLTESQPGLLEALEKLVEPYSSGDPMTPLRWTCKSTTNLSEELKIQGFSVSPTSVRGLLKMSGYSLQSNRKRFEGKQSPDRNSQFEYIAAAVEEFQNRGCPAISVDAKKRNWLATMPMLGVSGRKKSIRWKWRHMILLIRNWER